MSESRETLLFCTFVYDWYEHYIPPYIYSILRSYPEYHVRVLYRDVLSDDIREALNIVREISQRFEVIENFMPELQGDCRGIRWLLNRECFEPFDYAWIGDVDSLHIREDPTMLESELNIANKIGLPYVNKPWGMSEPHRWLLRGGMHFIKVKPYFDQMSKIIDQCLIDENIFPPDRFLKTEVGRASHSRASNVSNDRADEYLLYCLMERAFGVLTGDDERFSARYMYGIHLGEARGARNQRDTMYQHPHLPESVISILSETRFQRIYNLLDVRVQQGMDRTLRELKQGRFLTRLAGTGYFPDAQFCIAGDWQLKIQLDGKYCLIHDDETRLHTNESAAAVLALCDGRHSIMNIVDKLCDEFPSHATVIPTQVDEILSGLLTMGVISRN